MKKILIILFILFIGYWIDFPSLVYANEPPVIESITATPQSGYAPVEIGFFCNATDPDGYITDYKWDVDGDGFFEVSGVPDIFYRYSTPGVYNVEVIVTDNSGTQTRGTIQVTVYEGEGGETSSDVEITSLSATPQSGSAPLEVEFTCDVSSPSPLIFYFWDFDGDGIIDKSSTQSSTTYTYTQGGIYNATVIVEVLGGGGDQKSINISVEEPIENTPPTIISFSADPQSGETPLTVSFLCRAIDSEDNIDKYLWDFDGDSIIDEITNSSQTSHTYTEEGEYLPTVTVVDQGGLNATDEISIIVFKNETEQNPPEIISLSAEPGNNSMEMELSCEAYDPDGEVVKYVWDLDGDGFFDIETTTGDLNYVYTEEGTYNATVKVVDNNGLEATRSILIEVSETSLENPPQIISFHATPSLGNVPLEVNFTCEATDVDGEIREYRWDFDGDGRFDLTTNTNNATYTYHTVGTYVAMVSVIDNRDLASNSTIEIDVLDESIPVDNGLSLITRILENGTITNEDVQNLDNALDQIHTSITRNVQQGDLTPEEARAILRLSDDVVESHNNLIERGLQPNVENVNNILKVLPSVEDKAMENANLDVQEDVKNNLVQATRAIRTTIEALPPTQRIQLKDGVENLISTNGNMYSRVVSTATTTREGKTAFREVQRGLSDLPELTKNTIDISSAMEDHRLNEIIKEKQKNIFNKLSQGLQHDVMSHFSEINIEDVKGVNKIVASTVGSMIKKGVSMDGELLSAVSRVGGATLPAILDDVTARFNIFSNGFQGISNIFSENSTTNASEEIYNELNNRPYLYLKTADALGLDISDYIKTTNERRDIYDVPTSPLAPLYQEGNTTYTPLSLLKGAVNSTLTINSTVESQEMGALGISIEGVGLSVSIPKIQIMPVPPENYIVPSPDGKIIVYKNGIGLIIGSSPANPEEFLETMGEIKNYFSNLRIRSDGVILAQSGTTKIVSRLGYLTQGLSHFSQGGVSFSVSGTDPTSEAFRMLITYTDGTSQALPPYPVAGDRIFDLLESLFPGQWRFEVETGMIVILDSIKYKIDYNATTLDSEEMDWYQANKDPNFGLAFKTGDYNSDGKTDIKVYSPEGVQIYWTM